MLHSALSQFLGDVEWGDLDYLVIDLPPGTGDVQLSLAQLLPLTGAVIVTTPQDVALADVRKGMAAFDQLNVPLLGVIENMSYFVCPHCGERTDIFSHGGGRRAAEELGIPFLGEVAIDPAIRAGGDDGQPIVAVAPHSPQAQSITDIAGMLAAKISVLNMQREAEGLIQITEIG
jgi:ATP-binding protein involved in chromosome partitioning